jgi:hypothetical protein
MLAMICSSRPSLNAKSAAAGLDSPALLSARQDLHAGYDVFPFTGCHGLCDWGVSSRREGGVVPRLSTLLSCSIRPTD